ncbi:hypothetical protein HDU87_006253 [Geranomyces variabilis]|uniref:Uncharacterized protein n=1 Tax=Geranomyces variabilis TaxID=109894 RepID=A0AAD5TFX9_9FUNG|nr:hypothetical protein HDU87_006253 [Geranomyces variabilis]
MHAFAPDATNVGGVILWCASILTGCANLTYVARQDLVRHRGTRTVTMAISQGLMLGSYLVTLWNGYAFTTGNEVGYNAGYHFSTGLVIGGSFLALHVVEGFLPAVQVRMLYNPRWNVALKAGTRLVFVLCSATFLGTTIALAYHDAKHGLPQPGSLVDARAMAFTIWAAYAPFLACAISILVIRLVIGVKKGLASIDNFMQNGDAMEGGRPAAVAILDDIQRRAISGACIAIPASAGIAVSTAFPYTPILDGAATLYTSLFCSYLLFNIYIIRQVLQYSPTANAGNPTLNESTKKLRGLAAVRYSNTTQKQQALSGAEPTASIGSKRVSTTARDDLDFDMSPIPPMPSIPNYLGARPEVLGLP